MPLKEPDKNAASTSAAGSNIRKVGSRSFDRLPTLYDSFSHRWKSSKAMVPSSHSFFCALACSLHA